MPITYNLADLFEVVAAAVPEREAIVYGDLRLNFAELNLRATRLAAWMQQQGVGAGDTVGLQLYNGPEYLEGFLAACKLSAIPVNINFRYVADELEYLYENAELKALIYSQELNDVVAQLVDNSRFHACLSSGDSYEQIVTKGDDQYQIPVRRDDDLMLLYTGGTTGMPKGVMWPHKSLFFGALGGGGFYRQEGPIQQPEELGEVARNGHQLRYFAIPPLMHGAALWATLVALLAGQTVILRKEHEFNAEEIWNTVEREHVNIMAVVGDALAIPLLEALQANTERWNLSSLVHLGSGGGLFSAHVQDALRALLPNTTIADSMGSSEGGVIGSGKHPENGEGFIQLPPRADLGVAATDLKSLVNPGEQGFLVRSGFVPVGYYGDPEKSARTFFELDGVRYANTGDMAKLMEDGSIVVLGRGSQCINTGGEKVFPEEVEEVLLRHPLVRDALVVGVADPHWGQSVNAVITPLPGEEIEESELKRFCREHLAGYKVPKSMIMVEAIQRSPAGKADYRWAKSCIEQARTYNEQIEEALSAR